MKDALRLAVALLLATLGPAAAGAVEYVISVEYVEVSLGSGVTSASVNLTKGQDTTNCVPFASSTLTDTNARFARLLTDVYFETGPDRVTVQRDSGTGTTSVGVHVVEFHPAFVNVHQGTFANGLGAGQPTTSGVPAMDLAKAAMVFYYRFDDDTGGNEYAHTALAGWFGSTTQINWERNDASLGNINGHYYVFEARNDEFAVQTTNFSMAASATSVSSPLPATVDRDRSFVIASYRTQYADDDSEDGQFRISLPDAANVLASRSFGGGSGSNFIDDIRVFVVELGGSVRVQRGTLTYGDLDTVQTATVDAVNTSSAMAWNGALLGPGALEHHAFSSNDSDGAFQRLKLTDSTTVRGDRGEGTCNDPGNCDGVGSFEIVDFDPPSRMLIRTGSYVGGPPAGRHIHVGFAPDIVIIDRDDPANGADDEAVIRTATMTGDNTKDLDSANPLAGLKIQTLDATGFTIGTDVDVNQNGIVYHWVAFKAADGQLELGTYTGNGSTQDITSLGLDPAYLMVMSSNAHRTLTKSREMAANYSISLQAIAYTDAVQDLLPGGFRVGSNSQANQNLTTYHYAAWSASPDRVAVGRYVGDGSDNRDITGTGFWPAWTVVSRSDDSAGSQANVSVHKPASTGVGADAAPIFDGTLVVNNNIQALQADGFQVGSHGRVNSSAAPDDIYYWAAFGPFTPARLYRSVGIDGSNLNTGQTVEVTDRTATFSASMPDRIGVGDVLQYQVLGTWYLAFIEHRISDTSYLVGTSTGDPPQPTAAGTTVSVFRAYTSLSNWQAQNENGSINVAVRDFDTSRDLVANGTSMHTACYDDGPMDDMVDVTGWTTGPDNYVRIFTPFFSSEVGVSQRHDGTAGSGFRLTPTASGSAYQIINIGDAYVRIEGLEIDGTGVTNARYVRGVRVQPEISNVGDIRVDSCVIHDLHTTQAGFAFEGSMGIIDFHQTSSAGPPMRVTNNIIYDITNTVVEGHIAGIHIGSRATSYVYNNTVFRINNIGSGCSPNCGPAWGIYSKAFGGGTVDVVATNNYCGDVTAVNPVFRCFDTQSGSGLTQSYNVASDNSASGTGSVDLQTSYGTYFQSVTAGLEDLHVTDTSANLWGAPGADLSHEFPHDVDLQVRAAVWTIGADDPLATTEVELLSFDAVSRVGAIDLEWQTGSELNNLGFHLYRSLSPDGLWTRITPSIIPGLGSSPEGASYSFRDTGLQSGAAYYYKLEDIDSTSGSTFHGPVSATPSASAPEGEDEGEPEGEEGGESPDSEVSPERTSYGSPGKPQLRVLSRNSRAMVVELTTPGFVATDTPAGVRVSVRGFDARRHPEHPALPLKRALLNGIVGRHARVVWAREKQVSSFPDLVPAAVGSPEVFVGSDGTVQPRRREMEFAAVDGVHPLSAARIAGDAFIRRNKKLALELSPLRYDAASRTLHLAKKLQVKIAFDRQAPVSEDGSGSEGVRPPSSTTRPSGRVLAHLHTLQKGLHAVPYEALGLGGPISQKALRLSLQGQAVPHRVTPAAKKRFGPGSVLYFYAAHEASSLDHSSEATYALEQGPGGITMKALPASLKGLKPVSQAPSSEARFETNRFYQAGLLDASDIWLWDFVVGGMSKSFPFVLPGLDLTASAPVQLQVALQGASESETDGVHHLSVSVNGVPLGETTFDGKLPHVFTTTVPVSALLEGENTLEVTNLGDTGAYSFVFLDRFSLVHPRTRTLRNGRFDGAFSQKGRVSLPGAARYGMDVTDPSSPKWVKLHKTRSRRTFKALAGHRYVVASKSGLLSPRVSRPLETGLWEDWNQADYVLIAPAEFLDAGEPLLERRESQGLKTRAVSFEEIVPQFGHGRPSAAAIRDFLAYAYHHWEAPRLKYVLLLGDASYDPRNFTGLSKGSPLPALWAKTSYLVTSADPLLGAVNGEDGLADVAIGRLPALTVEEAEGLVRKVLDWEDGGLDLGGKAILVADNPDIAGDFEWDIADILESFLGGRDTETIHLRDHGGGTRTQVLNALDQGASLLSYVGHGGPAVWASENVLNSWDPPALLDQPEQPLMLTFNCLNGYFVAPNYDSLAEAFMKAEGRGTIGAFSPSGLSLDGPAHRFHRAVMDEIVNGNHERLGDAILAAQGAYAETGIMPELLAVYHLFADPGMKVR